MNTTPITPLREHIPIGKENAITRAELARLWSMDDRTVRETVARMRINQTDDPYAILSSSCNPPGYWRSDIRAELERYVKEGQARAKNTIAALGDARRVLNGQIAVAHFTGEARPARAGNQRFPAALPELCKAKSPVRHNRGR